MTSPAHPNPPIDTAAAEEQAQDLLEKYDPESRTREFRLPFWARVVTVVAVAVSLYHLYTAYFGAPPTLVHRSIHVSAMLALAFLLYPALRRVRRDRLQIYDLVLALLSLVPAVYIYVNYADLVRRGGRFDTMDVVVGVLLVLLVLEAARRVTGWALPLLAVLFVIYGIVGRDLPAAMRHRGYDWDFLANYMLTTNEGVFGTAIAVSATYIFLFILFGAVLSYSGMGQFFNDIALALAGRSRGGPAKVAVIASGFLGSINGAAVANVVTTGAFTIPLMKKVGYRKNFAGAVEASASVGGQLLPPIMGAAAFIMAETLGVPYTDIALAALIPALLYYIGVIAQVHLRATREGLKGISRENLPAVWEVLKERGHLLIPMVFLIYMLFFSGRTILYSAFLTIIVTVLVAMLRSTTRMSWREVLEALETGARSAVGVAVACASVGVIVGVVTVTGSGVKLANAIVDIGAGNLFLTLVLTMLACIVLGMGLPSVPAYIITATMAAPALVQLGVTPLVAHLFVFYFGIFANITPPVALASFAAAGISGGSAMKTGFMSMRLAAAGFLVPYAFVYNPALVLIDTSVGEAVWVVTTCLIGVLLLAVAIEGHLMTGMPVWLRIPLGIGAVLLVHPDVTLDVVGVALIVVSLVLQLIAAKKADSLSLRAI